MAFLSPPWRPGVVGRTVRRRRSVCHFVASSLPRVYVLPGMDGTASLLLDDFKSRLKGGASRVVLIDYPRQQYLSFQELADFVARQIRVEDAREYVVVAQSFSGHVALRLASDEGRLPVPPLGTVLVNCFCSAPFPSWLWPILRSIPPAIFAQTPPGWLISHFFFGDAGTAERISAVQRVVRSVAPRTMASRLSACVDESSWDLWRDQVALPGEAVLYLQSGSDLLCGDASQADLMRQARGDVEFHCIPDAPHMLLQTSGVECARVVDQFCAQRVARRQETKARDKDPHES